MQSAGLKISLPGKNVLTASGRNLVFNSNNDYLFIQKEGVIRDGESHNVAHGLGYYGTGMAWGDNTSNDFFKANIGDPNSPVAVVMAIDNYEAQITHDGTADGDEVYYMIFNDPTSY